MNVFDHVGVAVTSLEGATRIFEQLTGQTATPPETLEAHGVRVVFCGPVELLEPLSSETAVGRFLHTHGPGLHHIAYRSADVRGDLARLSAAGFELIDREPRPGAGGHRVAFLQPRSTGGALWEVVEHPGT